MLGRTLKLALVGLAVGAVGSLAASQIIASLLFHTEPNDPVTLAVVMLLLVSVALLAGYFPALCATRIDPVSVLRSE